MFKRPSKQAALETRLADEAKRLRDVAKLLRPGPARDAVLARQVSPPQLSSMRRSLAETKATGRQGSRLGEAVASRVNEASGCRETRKIHDIIFGRRTVNPETGLTHDCCLTNTNGCNHVQAVVLYGYNRRRDCCCSIYRLVALRYATSSDRSAIIDQSHGDDGNLQRSAR